LIPVTSLPWTRLPATALIAANLVVAAVTLYRGWGFYEIIIVYWCEALIIGGYNVAKLIMVGLAGHPFGKSIDAGDFLTRLFLLVIVLGFFVVKFGGFALATGLLAAAVPAFLGQARFGSARYMAWAARRGGRRGNWHRGAVHQSRHFVRHELPGAPRV